MPDILLENEGSMYFKPTCTGTASKRQYFIHNVSRIPLKYEWKMQHADAKVLSVYPASGVIQPNEMQVCEMYMQFIKNYPFLLCHAMKRYDKLIPQIMSSGWAEHCTGVW